MLRRADVRRPAILAADVGAVFAWVQISQLRDAIKGALDQVISTGTYADLLQRWSLTTGAVKSVSINGTTAD